MNTCVQLLCCRNVTHKEKKHYCVVCPYNSSHLDHF